MCCIKKLNVDQSSQELGPISSEKYKSFIAMLLPPITTLLTDLQSFKPIYEISIQPQSQEPKPRNALKSKFTLEEDQKLIELATKSTSRNWNMIAQQLGTRNARQCRERWNNYLNPNLRNDPWTEEEDRLLLEKSAIYGTHWNKISKSFRCRSDNSIRNRYQLLMRHMEKNNSLSSSSSPSHLSDE